MSKGPSRLGNDDLKVINIDYIISGAAREGAHVRARGRGGALDRLRTEISLRNVYAATDRMNKAYMVNPEIQVVVPFNG